MKEKRSSPPSRMSAEERREMILDAAIPIFATFGLHGASTLAIAAQAGISETYIFRLFGTKKDLFLASVGRVHGRIMELYRVAIEGDPAHPIDAIRASMRQAPRRRDEFLLLLQGYAAANDAEVQQVVQSYYTKMYQYIEQKVDASRVMGGQDMQGVQMEVRTFFAYNMLGIIAMALDLPFLVTPQRDVSQQDILPQQERHEESSKEPGE